MRSKNVLGKGLASLLPVGLPEENLQKKKFDSGETIVQRIALEDIHLNPFQPRRYFESEALKELAESIQVNGFLQPLLVRKIVDTHGEKLELIAGERRLRAAQKIGLKEVPVIIKNVTDKDSLAFALIENIQREDLNCVEEAQAYHQLMHEFSFTQETLSEKVGKERSTIANFLRLLRLPQLILEDLQSEALSLGHAKLLLSLVGLEEQLEVRQHILDKQLTVRQTEDLLEKRKPTKKQEKKISSSSLLTKRLHHLSEELSNRWSTPVAIQGNEKKGKITFFYSSAQDLDRLLEQMQEKKR